MLTRRQKQCLDFIGRFQRETGGVSPSFTQIMSAMNIASKSHVARLLAGLEANGSIRRLARKHCAIEVISIPIYDAQTHQIRGYVS